MTKIAHVSMSDLNGGAARSAFRIHRSLLSAGVDSKMYVRERTSEDLSVFPVEPASQRELDFFSDRKKKIAQESEVTAEALSHNRYFRSDLGREGQAINRAVRDADLVQLHWVSDNFLDYEAFFIARDPATPVVWRLPDMFPVTGGCHFSGDCDRYQSACGCCPVLESSTSDDLSAKILRRKTAAVNGFKGELTFVATCNWMKERIEKSPVAAGRNVVVIPNGVDTALFVPGAVEAFNARHHISGRLPKVLMK